MDEKSNHEYILAEAKRRRNEAVILDVEEKKVKLVVFSLLGDSYAFPGKDIREILRFEKITYVPGSPRILLGIINVRGDIESVLNLHRLLGLPDSKTGVDSRIVIAGNQEVRSGILVDSVEDVTDVYESAIQPPIATFDKSIKEFVVGVTDYRGRNVTILGVGNILGKLTPVAR
jgi:purine-binding chemotaxis protein CheW